MLTTDQFVYVKMHKTGCTHIGKVLESYFDCRKFAKHSSFNQRKDDRLFIGSVRNPWDWYVSLWAFGCGGEGRVRKVLNEIMVKRAAAEAGVGVTTSVHKNLVDWNYLYSDVENAEIFRDWLRAILGEQGQRALIEGYTFSNLRFFSGFMNYRFCQLHIRFGKLSELNSSISNFDQLAELYDKFKLIDRFIRTERLEEDLAGIMAELGVDVSVEELKSHGKTNTSQHRPFASYYDQETSDLVASKEKLIINLFGYQPPPLS